MARTRIALPGVDPKVDTPLRRALRACRQQFWVIGVFSGVINLLQLTGSIYMMQVFDRVLASRSLETLYFLSLLAIVATLVLALLETVRGQVMQRLAAWVEHQTAPESFVRAIESTLRSHLYRMEALRDLAICRSFLGSAGAMSLYDVPWVPIYLGFIFMLHPVMGFIALGGAVILFGLTLVSELSTSKLLKEANTAAMTSQRRADAISRNAEVIDSMGMLPAVIGHWRESVAAMTEPQQRAADRAAILVAATKFFRIAV
jgi:ABC-type protease/lipase transport system fused ATPase/permease subunit